MKVAILTDSTCDLTDDILKERDIHVIPLYVTFGDESYKDKVELQTEKLYELVEKKNELPKTSASTPEDFVEVFNELFKSYDQIFYTGISQQMSSTLNNARIASEMIGKEDSIALIDSANLSTGIALLVLKAAKFRDEGLNAFEIAKEIEKIRPNVRSQFVIETMEFLYKGGRCTSVQHFLGKMFKIKPIIEVRGGRMDVGKKPRGKMKKALDELIDYLKDDMKRHQIDADQIFITHSLAYEYRDYLEAELKKITDIKLVSTVAGCVISSHCGKGTIGILYIIKD